MSDLFSGFFSAQELRPEAFSAYDISKVPPFLRSLLVKDGTVTTALAAYFLQPIFTQQVSQTLDALSQPNDWLDLQVGDEVLKRCVTLSGQKSNHLYLYAESEMAFSRLPNSFREGLEKKDSNLGKLLRDSGVETRREGLWWGLVKASRMQTLPREYDHKNFVGRVYRISFGGQPMLMVAEYFPLDCFLDNPPSTVIEL
ncbi:MAG: chorismate pyruvate-lyase family protein [Pseudomonadota bacterium]